MRFKFFGANIHISFLFSAVIVILLIYDKSYTAIFSLIACVLHEMGHLVCFICCGLTPINVELNAFGMRINRDQNMKLSLKQEAIAAFCGPAVNLVIALISYLICLGNAVNKATIINLMMACFNLLPIFELDGGRAIYYMLCNKYEEEKVEKIITILSIITLFILYLLGFLILIKSRYNFTLLAATVYLTFLTIKKKKM